MAKSKVEKVGVNRVEKPITNTEDNFIELMMFAAEFTKGFGGIEQAKRALEETGRFIERAGNVASAAKSLDVLENLKSKISD